MLVHLFFVDAFVGCDFGLGDVQFRGKWFEGAASLINWAVASGDMVSSTEYLSFVTTRSCYSDVFGSARFTRGKICYREDCDK